MLRRGNEGSMIQHGTPQRYFLKCRCVPCRAAYSQYVCWRRREREQGRGGLVSAGRARRHIARWNLKEASEVIGISACTLSRIRTGKVERIWRSTEEAILAGSKRVINSRVTRKPYVNADPARRKLRLLRKQGFSGLELGRRFGLAAAPRLIGKRARARTADRVEKFYAMITAEAAA